MGSSQSPVPEQCHKPSDYPTADSKSKMMLKSRRGRTSFSPGQLSDLEAAFTNTHYPDFQTRKDLSNTLKIPDDRIQVRSLLYNFIFLSNTMYNAMHPKNS